MNPIFGVEFVVEDKPENIHKLTVKTAQDNVEIVNQDEDHPDVFTAYYADGVKNSDRDPVFCSEIGLAIEGLRDGITIDQLWSVF